MQEQKKKNVNRMIRLDSELDKKVIEQATREERTIPSLIRYALKWYLKECNKNSIDLAEQNEDMEFEEPIDDGTCECGIPNCKGHRT